MTGEIILVVEDEGLIAFHLTELLENAGYQVIDPTCSGEVALRTLEKSPEPDLILMDVKLGGSLDGIETARQIRQRYSIPLIFVTAYSSERLLERMREVAPEGVITKPFVREDLLALIEKTLDLPPV
jgi:CheY-like chemotaxis protein